MSTFPAGQQAYPESFMEPTRTSLSAIVALVFGILCPVPILGALAVLIGLVALISISRSGGRLGGTGLAVTGMILGLIGTVIWLGIGIGGAQVMKMYSSTMATPTRDAIAAAITGEAQPMRALLVPKTAEGLTDEQITAFGALVNAELGQIKQPPRGLMGIARAYGAAAQAMQRFGQGPRNNQVPMPFEFEKGWGLVMLQMPSGPVKGPQTNQVPILNIGVVNADGTREFWLADPAPGTIVVPVPTPGAAPETPATPPEPQSP